MKRHTIGKGRSTRNWSSSSSCISGGQGRGDFGGSCGSDGDGPTGQAGCRRCPLDHRRRAGNGSRCHCGRCLTPSHACEIHDARRGLPVASLELSKIGLVHGPLFVGNVEADTFMSVCVDGDRQEGECCCCCEEGGTSVDHGGADGEGWEMATEVERRTGWRW